ALDVGVEAIWERIRHLAETLRGELAAIPGVEVHDPGRVRGGIVTFTVAGRAPTAIREELERRRMNVSVSTVASARFDMEARGLDAVVRASPHAYNTEAELARFCEVVGELAAQG
ncbi:MAG TPA: aminotransferase class V-fold PLP-dependent enzyme, partial [Actinobacteria bacterium]|nr:aminotransferase class V-fold PLP-dependent enzyme [Actinomycetota bacterium]